MASWSELLAELQAQKNPNWLDEKLKEHLDAISKRRGNAAVIFYATAFLQKAADNVSITREDINGFMNALYEAPTDKGLVLILHTPGGDPNAVESIVEYLHSKFDRIDVVVPYLAMSGGAMISLAGDLLVLGRQSQLGPIDPQFVIGNKTHSARAIQEGFSKAREDIEKDTKLAHLWAPILQNMGPSLVLEADKALSYSKELVVGWLHRRMLKGVSNEEERKTKADTIAAYFNAEDTPSHGQVHVHGQRIGAEKLEELGLKLEFLEDDQDLQNDVLTAYHLMTLIFEKSPSLKFITSDKGKMWVKQQQQILIPSPPPVPQQSSPDAFVDRSLRSADVEDRKSAIACNPIAPKLT